MFLFYLTTTVIGPDIFYLYNPHYEANLELARWTKYV